MQPSKQVLKLIGRYSSVKMTLNTSSSVLETSRRDGKKDIIQVLEGIKSNNKVQTKYSHPQVQYMNL